MAAVKECVELFSEITMEVEIDSPMEQVVDEDSFITQQVLLDSYLEAVEGC